MSKKPAAGAEFNKYDEPPEHDVLRGHKPQLPHFVTPDTLRIMGVPQAMIDSLHPLSTPIVYFEADQRNAQEKANFEADNPGATHIPSYLTMSGIVKGEANPQGSVGLEQVHAGTKPLSNWHASQEELTEHLREVSGLDIAAKVLAVLDLPKTPNYASKAELEPYEFRDLSTLDEGYSGQMVMVELSFNRVGTAQAVIDNKKMRYSGTVPIGQIGKHLKPEGS